MRKPQSSKTLLIGGVAAVVLLGGGGLFLALNRSDARPAAEGEASHAEEEGHAEGEGVEAPEGVVALTPEQRRAKAVEDDRRAAIERQQEDVARRDRALLASYTTEAEIDLARDTEAERGIAPVVARDPGQQLARALLGFGSGETMRTRRMSYR